MFRRQTTLVKIVKHAKLNCQKINAVEKLFGAGIFNQKFLANFTNNYEETVSNTMN